MTTTAPEAETLLDDFDPAEANARWVQETWANGDAEVLPFLRFRPHRELEDSAAAALRIGCTEAASILTDAATLAKGHTGSPSPTPAGYTAIDYPVTEADVAALLHDAGDAVALLNLPGTQHGWTWATSVAVDPDERTVTVVARARHPRLAEPAAAEPETPPAS